MQDGESRELIRHRKVETHITKLEVELTDKIKGLRLTRKQLQVIKDKSVSDLLRVAAIGDLEFLQKKLASTCQSIFDYYIVGNKKMDKKINAQIIADMQAWVNTPAPAAYKKRPAVMFAAKYFSAGQRIDAIKLLAGFGADLNAQDADGNTVLHKFCMGPLTEKTFTYIYNLGQLGAAAGITNKKNQTPTHIMVTRGFKIESVHLVVTAKYYEPPKPAAISNSATLVLIKKFEAERPRVQGDESSCIVM